MIISSFLTRSGCEMDTIRNRGGALLMMADESGLMVIVSVVLACNSATTHNLLFKILNIAEDLKASA